MKTYYCGIKVEAKKHQEAVELSKTKIEYIQTPSCYIDGTIVSLWMGIFIGGSLIALVLNTLNIND